MRKRQCVRGEIMKLRLLAFSGSRRGVYRMSQYWIISKTRMIGKWLLLNKSGWSDRSEYEEQNVRSIAERVPQVELRGVGVPRVFRR